jgi:hypothetical protein
MGIELSFRKSLKPAYQKRKEQGALLVRTWQKD